MTFVIKRISAQDTLPLRQTVLWPNHPIEMSQLENDDTASHFGGFVGDKLICVASLFRDGNAARLRKFATDPQFQQQGYGSRMLGHLLEQAETMGAHSFWFDARESALPFYERNGYAAKGDRFFKGQIPYRRVEKRLTPSGLKGSS